MQLKLSEPVVKLFDTLGRYAAQPYRTIFANVGAFLPVLDLIGRKSGGNLNALMRTTVALTQMRGSAAPNVIPPKAEIVTNIRNHPWEQRTHSPRGARAHHRVLHQAHAPVLGAHRLCSCTDIG